MDWTQVGIKAIIAGVIAVAAKLSVEPVITEWSTLWVTIGAAFILGAVNVINQAWPSPVSASHKKKPSLLSRIRAAI